eukprot:2961046-Alexandrium_andersonii.AAC.1
MHDLVSEQLSDTQFGFRKARSTGDPIHLIRRKQDSVSEKKYPSLHIEFLDWSKAFDRIVR